MNKNTVFLGMTLLGGVILGVLLLRGAGAVEAWERKDSPASRRLVEILSLTDFAIWTEARYTRHPSQADLFTPFQSFPSSFEHFPAGSVIAPPGRSGPVAPHRGER